jgi:hypothetical protein
MYDYGESEVYSDISSKATVIQHFPTSSLSNAPGLQDQLPEECQLGLEEPSVNKLN